MDPAGVFATTYQRDQALIRTRAQAIGLLVLLVLLLLLPQLVGSRLMAMVSVMMISAVTRQAGVTSKPGLCAATPGRECTSRGSRSSITMRIPSRDSQSMLDDGAAT